MNKVNIAFLGLCATLLLPNVASAADYNNYGRDRSNHNSDRNGHNWDRGHRGGGDQMDRMSNADLIAWERRLQDGIDQNVQNRSLTGMQAWEIQKEFDKLRMVRIQYANSGGMTASLHRQITDGLRRVEDEIGGRR